MNTTTPTPGAPDIEPVKSSRWPSLVWLVPALAILAAIGLLFQNLATRGPLIEIELDTASGLKAGETVIKYRDVNVGRVETVRFSEDLTKVVIEARMDQSVAPYLDDDAKFWIVSPQVSAQGISGLETVLTGSYIEGSWDTEAETTQKRFTALDQPPLTPDGAPGIRLKLRAEDGGSLDLGSPIFYKRVEVGRVESKQLTEDGRAVEFDVFINAPHDKRVTRTTKFWNASGIDLELGAGGAKLHIASISSLIRGGASFDTSPGGDPIETGQIFQLFPSQSDAQDVLDTDISIGEQVVFDILFGGSVRGLKSGAPVEYRGIRVGRVEAVTASVDAAINRFRTRTRISIAPSLLGLGDSGEEAVMAFMRTAVADGLRAKLALGNLLTGALYVELDDVAVTPPSAIDESGAVPVLPAVASDLDELAGSVEGVLDRVNALPVEALMANAVSLLENLNTVVGDDATKAVPAKTLALLSAAEALIAGPELRQTTVDASAMVAALRSLAEDPALAAAPGQMGQTLASLNAILATLEEAGTADDIAASIASLRAVAQDPALAAAPGQMGQSLASLSTLLSDLEKAGTAADIAASVTALRAVLEDPALIAAPTQMGQSLASLSALLGALEEADAAANLGASLAALRVVAEDPALALLPGSLNQTISAANAILSNPAMADLPGEINATLGAVRTTLDLPGLDALPGEVSAALISLRTRLDDPALAQAIAELGPLIASARATADDTGPLVASLQSLLDDPDLKEAPEALRGALVAARELLEEQGLRDASVEAAATLASLRKILDAPETQAAPGELNATFTAARGLLEDLVEQKAAENLAQTLAATRRLAEDPAVVRAADAMASAFLAMEAVLAAPGAEELPAAATDALNEAATLIAQFQKENLGAASVAALSGVTSASRAVQQAAAGVPALLARLSEVSARADALLESVSVGSELNYEAVSAIRDIRDAARAVTELTELAQQKPTSFIFGK